MIRRTVLAATALLVLAGVADSALASTPQDNGNAICVATRDASTGHHDGLCFYVVLPVTPQP